MDKVKILFQFYQKNNSWLTLKSNSEKLLYVEFYERNYDIRRFKIPAELNNYVNEENLKDFIDDTFYSEHINSLTLKQFIDLIILMCQGSKTI